MAIRPAWVNQEMFPFDSHFVEVERARVLYIDEDQGPVLQGDDGAAPGRLHAGRHQGPYWQPAPEIRQLTLQLLLEQQGQVAR